MNKTDCILLLSGGMDSGVLLAKLVAEGRHPLALSFIYPTKHNRNELEMARKLAQLYKVQQRTVSLDFLGELLHSSLLIGGSELPYGEYSEESLRQTVIPFRNGIFLSIAAALAEDLKIPQVFIASHSRDHAIYPDCRSFFTSAFSDATRLGTYTGVRIETPFTTFTKREIAELGRKLNFDFTLTWSCYAGGELHCGNCSTCSERKLALRSDAGLDPTLYSQ